MEAKSEKAVVAGQYDSAGKTWHSIRGSGHELLEKPAFCEAIVKSGGPDAWWKT